MENNRDILLNDRRKREQLEDNKKLEKERKKKKKKYIINGSIVFVLSLIWIAIFYFGANTAKNYIDNAIINIEMKSIENHQMLLSENTAFSIEVNNLNIEIKILREDIKVLNGKMESFSLNVSSLKSSIDNIDTSVSSSVEIQAEIGARILELDNKLKSLRKSLDILSEAPNE